MTDHTLWTVFGGTNPFYDALKLNCQRHPREDALVWINAKCQVTSRLTFRALFENARRVAMHLRLIEKVKPGDPILLVYPPDSNPDFVVSFFACLFVGAVAVPTYPVDPAKAQSDVPRLVEVLTTAGANFALTNTAYRRVARLVGTLVRNQRWSDIRWVCTNDILSAATTASTLRQYGAIQSNRQLTVTSPLLPIPSLSSVFSRVGRRRESALDCTTGHTPGNRVSVTAASTPTGLFMEELQGEHKLQEESDDSTTIRELEGQVGAKLKARVGSRTVRVCDQIEAPCTNDAGACKAALIYQARYIKTGSVSSNENSTRESSIEASGEMSDGGQPLKISATAQRPSECSERRYPRQPELMAAFELSEEDYVYYEKNVRLVFRPQTVQSKSIAFLQFTSGSTASPRGVMVTHGGLLHNCHLVVRACNFVTTYERPSDADPVQWKEEEGEVMAAEMFDLADYRSKFWPARHAISMKRLGHRVRAFSWLPIYHDMGLIGCTVAPLIFGLTAYQMSPLDFIRRPHLWLEGMSRYECFTSGAPNFGFELAARKTPDNICATLELSRVTSLLCGAEPIRPATYEAFMKKFGPQGFRNNAFLPAYGLAEHTLIVAGRAHFNSTPKILCVDSDKVAEQLMFKVVKDDDDSCKNSRWLMGCGAPCPSVDVRIINPDTLLPCSPGQIGEIWVRSLSTATGYFHDQLKTGAAFNCAAVVNGKQVNGFLRTGDSGVLHEGEVFVTGRMKDVLIIRGRNYYPQDIEAIVESCSNIRPGCVAAFPMEHDNQEVLGIVAELKEAAIREKTPSGLFAAAAALSWIKETFCRFTVSHSSNAPFHHSEVAEEIAVSVFGTSALQVHGLWLLRPKSIPKTTSGKIRRSTTRDRVLAGKLGGVLETYSHPIGGGKAVVAREVAGGK